MSQQQLETLGFGAGIVLATPQGGQLGPNPTPVEVGTVQGVKLTISADIKSLFGLNSFAVDSAIGKRTIKGSFDYAQISGALINNLLFGASGSSAAGSTGTVAYREIDTIPSTSAYTISVTNAATFVSDNGVIYAGGNSTGKPFTRIISGTPTVGQYSVSAGVYTFAAADEGVSVAISYTYGSTTDGQTFSITNSAMGAGPILSLQFPSPYQSPSLAQLDRGIYLPNVRVGKLDLTTKLDDYEMFASDFEAFANPVTGIVMQSFMPW